jgi:hypothetical protein
VLRSGETPRIVAGGATSLARSASTVLTLHLDRRSAFRQRGLATTPLQEAARPLLIRLASRRRDGRRHGRRSKIVPALSRRPRR